MKVSRQLEVLVTSRKVKERPTHLQYGVLWASETVWNFGTNYSNSKYKFTESRGLCPATGCLRNM